jgi:molybdenum cofactor cytidylyltransferase
MAAGHDFPSFDAVVLAAGRSTRMGGPNKLLIDIDGEPLIRRTLRAVRAARPDRVVVVTGFEADAVREAVGDLPDRIVHNPDFDQGMASSLKAGVAACTHCASAMICLGDMPWVRARTMRRMWEVADHRRIVVPVFQGRWGNPVIWSSAYFPELAALAGDRGARSLMERYPPTLLETDDAGILRDVDTPEALDADRP